MKSCQLVICSNKSMHITEFVIRYHSYKIPPLNRILSQRNSLHIFRETVGSIRQSTSASPMVHFPSAFRHNFSCFFIFHHYLVSRPPIISSLSIFGEVYNILLLTSANIDHIQGEMTALWHFTILYQKSLVTSTSSVLFTRNAAISCGPIIKQHVISSRSITKPLVCNNFWIAFGVISCYIALSRTAGLVFSSLISLFITLQTYSSRAMGSGLEIIWKVLAVVLFEVPAHHVLGGLRNTTKTSG
jgi:hypothetical protein